MYKMWGYVNLKPEKAAGVYSETMNRLLDL
jgi:hypothetical protein